MSRFHVKKVAVLGAGVWGRRLPPTWSTPRVPVVLFDLPAKEGPKNGIVPARHREPEEALARAARHQGRGRP